MPLNFVEKYLYSSYYFEIKGMEKIFCGNDSSKIILTHYTLHRNALKISYLT
jgi:hypothetical protein